VGPGVAEACDGLDTDCDGVIPEDEIDADADGERICDGDCDDTDPAVASALPEVCDRVDNDCDGAVDEDHDRDLDGYSECGSDCNDRLQTVYPGAAVECEPDRDNNCNGIQDIEEPACTAPEASCLGAGSRLGPASPSSAFALLLGLLGLALRTPGRRDQRS
jgi:hypothetical protein